MDESRVAGASAADGEIDGQPASRGPSVEERVLDLLMKEPMTKMELSEELGQASVTGRLRTVLRQLVNERDIAAVGTGKRNLKYQLTDRGRAVVMRRRNQR